MTASESGVDNIYQSMAEADAVFRSDCPSRPILDQIADKWSMMVMAVLERAAPVQRDQAPPRRRDPASPDAHSAPPGTQRDD